jgi:hypothetical protein
VTIGQSPTDQSPHIDHLAFGSSALKFALAKSALALLAISSISAGFFFGLFFGLLFQPTSSQLQWHHFSLQIPTIFHL